MCELCDGRQPEELLQRQKEAIDDGRWLIQQVEGIRPWSYTVGLADLGLVELVMLGPIRPAGVVINELARTQVAGLRVDAGTEHELSGGTYVLDAIDQRHLDRGLMAFWTAAHGWAGLDVPLRALQIRRHSEITHPPLSARTLSGTSDPLDLRGRFMDVGHRPRSRRIS